MSWFDWLTGQDPEESKDRLQRAKHAEAVALQQQRVVTERWPTVNYETEQVRMVLAENGFAPKIWEAMKARRW